MIWHHIKKADDPELDALAIRYGLHPLHIEDCRHRNQSAKLEEQDGYIFVVLKPILQLQDDTLQIVDLDIFLGKDYIITVQDSQCLSSKSVIEASKNAGTQRADQFFYRIMDALVDTYVPIIDRFSEGIDDLEDRVLDDPKPQVLQRIFFAKRNLIEMRRVLANMRDVAGHLMRLHMGLIDQDMWPFLRDVYDHLARNLDRVETQRDLLSGSLDIYLSSVANRTNQVMKVLTVMSTIALPAIVISSFFGMNTKDLPIINEPHATAIVTLMMVAATVGLLALLRWFRWL